MKYYIHTGKILGGFLLVLLTSVRVLAAGTDAGAVITNAVTLNYQVNTISQTTLTTSVNFTVDRALSVLVTTQDTNVIDVVPGLSPAATGVPALNFDVTNTSNADMDLLLGVVDQDATAVTGFAGNAGPASFNGTGLILALDTNGNGLYDNAVDTNLSVAGNHFVLPAASITRDAATRILLVVGVPLAQVEADQATYTLVAAVASGGVVIQVDSNGNASPGATTATSDVADDSATMQDLFADIAAVAAEDATFDFVGDTALAAADIVSNGQASDTSAFVVNTAEIAVAKSVEVLWDPINGNKYTTLGALTGGNPKAIPGALMMYVIGVSNAAASSNTVTNVALTDDLPEGGAMGLVEGNTTGEPSANIFVPASTSLDFGAGAVAVTIPNPADKTQLTVSSCAGATSNVAFNLGAGPEISASVGTCAAGQTGVIVYFVTLQ